MRALDSSLDEKKKAEEFGCRYYLPEAEQEEEVQQKLVEIRKDFAGLEPKDINCIDKTTPRLLQSHTLENAVKPPVLGGFFISGVSAA